MIFPIFTLIAEQTEFMNIHFSSSFYQLEILDFLLTADLTEILLRCPIIADLNDTSNLIIYYHKLHLYTICPNERSLIMLMNDPFFNFFLIENFDLIEPFVFYNSKPFFLFDKETGDFSDDLYEILINSSEPFWLSLEWKFNDESINFFEMNLNEIGDKIFANVFKNMEAEAPFTEAWLEDLTYLDNLSNMTSLYQYSVPNTKLAYPEPFIASASFMHSDLWFAHILIYQYWLWFIFTFLIIFFFLTFISVVRWCNMRVRPRRETRGVSRSKCGDLITACVPVSWATSIIVNESTDAIDFYDGFGTTELVIGVRAYQWGWEYYYPKDIDLNYNIKKNYSTFIGNSIKYNSTSSLNLKANNFWKFYQNKNADSSVLPAHFFLFSFDNYKLLHFLNFSEIGANSLQESGAFKKTKTFFKFFNLNSFTNYSLFNIKYKKFSNLYLNDTSLFESVNYGLKRNHNFLSLNSNNNAHSTYLNVKSFKKLLNFNFNVSNLAFIDKNVFNFSKIEMFNFYFTKTLTKNTNLFDFFLFTKQQTFNNILNVFNNDTDKKQLIYPIFKTLNLLKKKTNFDNFNSFKNFNFNSNFIYQQNNNLNNMTFSYKNYTPFSNNLSISTNTKHIRNFVNTSVSSTPAHYTFQSNILTNYIREMNIQTNNNIKFLYNWSNSNWISNNTFLQLSLNKINLDSPISPIIANNSYLQPLQYDDCNNSLIENVPTVLQGKEDNLPNFITTAYWNFYWNNKDVAVRLNNNFVYSQNVRHFYFPLFNFSYDYDFRNWQSLELLEDSFWENSFPSYSYEEYLEIFNDFLITNDMPVFLEYFNQKKSHNSNLNVITVLNSKNFLENFYDFTVYFDDNIFNVNALNLSRLTNFPLINSVAIDDTYESVKSVSFLFNDFFKNSFNSNCVFFNQHTHFLLANSFRSDYDDVNWYHNENIEIFNLKTFVNFSQKNNFLFLNFEYPITAHFSFLNFNNEKRFDNLFNLRSTTKNSMVTYNALQKVFRTRLDEGRSNTKLLDFSNSYDKQPYLSSLRAPYENLLGKNKNVFYKNNFYKNNFYSYFNLTYDVSTSINFYTYDFPFLLGAKSDASKHIWFDWFAKWGFYEVQPSSSARYAIHGLPHFNKFFEFTSNQNEILNESESYLLRLSKARKNYLPGWSYTPYFYAKNNHWFKNNLFFNTVQVQNSLLNSSQMFLNDSLWYNTSIKHEFLSHATFSTATSNINSYAKTAWKPFASTAAYYFNVSNLIDILTKREQLYRQFLSSRHLLLNLPDYVSNGPQNSLVKEIKTMFDFVDPLFCNNEYSKDLHYNSLAMFNYYIFKNTFLTNFQINDIANNFFFFFFDEKNTNYLTNNNELYKNQYRPLRKGINNMLRLHATGAVAMPIEIRLQILASSKDVIHSWAIPSAGIKIDCVPGYSSHKVMIFLVSGIFWGQCMEICGRYHHWMPIVVYFMKRDLFFLWCNHFVFSNQNNLWNSNDRQFTEIIKLVSYDKNSWISEFLN